MERLDKILSHLNYGTRKEVKKIIRNGYVYVNGENILDDDFKVDPINDEIVVGDDEITYNSHLYFMLNKPKDYISQTYDPKYPTVIDILDEYRKMKIFPIGRLDVDTTGLILISNDGSLCHKLLSPKYNVEKEYNVIYEGTMPKNVNEIIKDGLDIDDYHTKPIKIKEISGSEANIIITEGKYHEVKKIFKALGMTVIKLKRIRFKNLWLDENLKEGEFRALSEEELEGLLNE
jgi:16S rRNA pseudouridine516 synthase